MEITEYIAWQVLASHAGVFRGARFSSLPQARQVFEGEEKQGG